MTTEREARYRVSVEKDGDTGAFQDIADGIEQAGEAAEQTARDASRLGDLYDNAREKLKTFAETVEKGNEGVEEGATRALLTLRRLQQAAEDLKASGRNLTDDQVRELEELERAYKDAVRGAGEYKRAQIEATRDVESATARTGEYRGSISSLADVFEQVSPKAARFALQGTAVVGALTAGYSAGTKFREGLGELDKLLGTSMLQSMDNFVQRAFLMQQAMDRLVGALQSPAEESRELLNILNILRAQGIKPVSSNLDELRAQLDQVSRAKGEVAQEALAAKAAQEEWTASMGLSREELDKQSKELAKFVAAFIEQNDQLDLSGISSRLKDQIQGILDKYRDLGTEAPKELQKVANALGILSTAQQETLDKHKQFLGEYQKAINDALGGVDEDVQERAAAIKETLANLAPKQNELRFLPPEQQAKLREELEEMIDTLRAAGQAITPEIQQIANQVGLLVPQWEAVAPAADSGAKGLDRGGEAAGRAADGLSKLRTESEGIAEVMGRQQTATDAVAGSAVRAGERTKEAASSIREGASAISDQADAAGEAGPKLGAAATASEDLAKAQHDAQGKLAGTSEEIRSLAEKIGSLETRSRGLATSLGATFGGLSSGISSVITLVGQLSTALDDALLKLEKLRDFDDVPDGAG